uniref:cadherin-like protein 26 n=1 Tax=Scatophagus argus TaxID=75038 RepID=UPI001ED7FB8A|nr:cadherin-like protein 26 [Scatophagus argus]
MLCFFLLVFYLSSATSSELLSRHRRSWIIDSFTIEEENPGPFPYVLGNISINRNYRVYFDLFGEGVDEEPKDVFSIDKESGILLVHRAVDYEEKTMLKLKFEARKTDLSIDTNLGILISILDINDNPPRFQKDLYEIEVSEGDAQGSHLLTVVAYDNDKRGTLNSTVHYEIKSVSPNTSDTEFFINESGMISFKGCLDREVAEMFTVLVEAKDQGEVVSLSSSTTVVVHVQDDNNHLPTISGQTGSGTVKEHETGTSPLRLHVIDKDTPNSLAWRVRYTIHGDEGKHFMIETDPDTNDGILTVVKPLDFEEGAQRQLSISVENEMPYYSCKVKNRISSGLWDVETGTGDADQPHSVKVLIEVEDINDPPVFSVTVKKAMLEENSPIGTWVEKVTAVDPDSSHARDFVYKVGNDPAGWLTVDSHTGDITTVKIPDRESPHVVDGIYTILLNAVDDGNPPLTGTATLNIHMIDQNDNVPQPTEHNVDMCLSDSPTTTNITAFDLDGNPFGGPFSFELMGDVEGKWKLSPSYGYTAGLVKEPGVYAGHHTIDVKISDMQGEFGVYNISVTVCDCSVTPNCQRRVAATKAAGAVGVVFASLFLLLFLLFLAIAISCKKEFIALQADSSSGETLLPSNIEEPGKDCKLPDSILVVSADKKNYSMPDWHGQLDGIPQGQVSATNVEQKTTFKDHGDYRRESISYLFNEDWNDITNWNSATANSYHDIKQMENMSTMHVRNSSYGPDAALLTLLDQSPFLLQRLSSLQETEDDLLDYWPHLYTDEGNLDNFSELDNITIPDNDSFQKVLKDLGPEFNQLASICKPPQN